MASCGLDCGTFNLISARRTENNEIKFKREVNAFIEIPLENPFTFNMLKAAKVKLIEREKVAYAVSEAAVNLAHTLNLNLRRPMKDGCINPQEQDAFGILNIMIHSMIGEPSVDKEVLCYSIPSSAVNTETDSDYHQKILEQIFKGFKSKEGKTVVAKPVNEALAIIFAELADKFYTGCGVSFGSGMVNVCYAILSKPVFQFSIVNSGDWIDKQAAKACGETPIIINKEKTKVDLTKTPVTLIERAITSQYRIMIEKTISSMKDAMQNKVRSDNPIDIVVAGGTSSPNGFIEMFKEVVDQVGLPMSIGEIRKASDHLNTVAKGCLIAAENSQ